MKVTERLCPICRTSNYQKKITHKGSKAFEVVCAIKLQALWRGYSQRKEYYDIRKAFYKDGRGNSLQRAKFYEHEFSLLSDRMSRDIDMRDFEVNDTINASNHTLLESRQLDILFESMLLSRIETQRSLPIEDSIPPKAAPSKAKSSLSESEWKGMSHIHLHYLNFNFPVTCLPTFSYFGKSC